MDIRFSGFIAFLAINMEFEKFLKIILTFKKYTAIINIKILRTKSLLDILWQK